MKCQFLFSGKNKEKKSVCCLLKILSIVLSVKLFPSHKIQSKLVKTGRVHSSPTSLL